MTIKKSFEPGTSCWTDLATTDPKKALAFYKGLFGWASQDIPMAEGGVYTMLLKDQHEVGALSQMRPEEAKHGVPSHWNLYVSVENADLSTEKAKSLGAKIIMPPMD